MRKKLRNMLIYIISFLIAFQIIKAASNIFFLYTSVDVTIGSEFITVLILFALTATFAETTILIIKKKS